MKKLIGMICISLIIVLVSGCGKEEVKSPQATKDGKPLIVIYGDFKCPYCKKVEKNVMPKLKEKYLNNHKAEIKYVNMAFLGKDSIIGSRAGHAVQNIAPRSYLQFQKLMFEHQQDEKKAWITEKVVDQQIDHLNISADQKEKIKSEYKTKNSAAWKAANKDKKDTKAHHIKTAPTVFINGKKVEDPYHFKEYDKLLQSK